MPLSDVIKSVSPVGSAAVAGGASVIGSAISAYANHKENELAFKRQLQLNKQNYIDYIDYARKAGATPAAIAQGLTQGGAGSMPTTSTSNNPVPDFGQSVSSGISASAAFGQSQAANITANSERDINLMKLQFEPQKYFADIKKALAEAFENTQHAYLHGSMKHYYNELSTDLQQMRPWKIAGLKMGLVKDMATYNNILADTDAKKSLKKVYDAQEGYYHSAAHELDTRADMNVSQTNLNWNYALNEGLRGFRLQWENTLLANGIDTSKSFWDNTGRLMLTNPTLFKQRMNTFISTLNLLDNKIQENLGDNYKRNIALGYGLYKLNQMHQRNANSRSYRNSNAANVISKFIPFLGGTSFPSVGESGPGVDWWLKD